MKSLTPPESPAVVSVCIDREVWERVDRRRLDVDRVCTLALKMAVEIIEDDDQYHRDNA